MNLLLHGIGEDASNSDLPIICTDSLKQPPAFQANVILTNPPFGTRGSVTFTQRKGDAKQGDLVIVRPDFWVKTANKQLNFVQHVVSMLKPGGRAAMVLPDNVLFESGAAATLRRRLLESCDVHTLLRLPTGLFYAQGVKANVLFFDKPSTKRTTRNSSLWVYNLRGKRVSLKQNPLRREDLADFVSCFQPGRRMTPLHDGDGQSHDRWRRFDTHAILRREECRLDLSWVVAAPPRTSEVKAELDEIAGLIAADLRDALTQIAKITDARRDRP